MRYRLARPKTPKCGYLPDPTNRNVGSGQSRQTEIWVLARPNRPQTCWPDGRRNQNFFQTIELGRTGPPVRDPSRSGQCLFWVADFTLGITDR